MNEYRTLEMLRTMLSLQEAINHKINIQWREARNPWYRAIWTECAELIDHIGWKWWKKKEPNLEQVKLEIIDIWHFGLSAVLEKHESVDAAVSALSAQMPQLEKAEAVSANELITLVEKLASKVLETKAFDVDSFAQLMSGAGLSLPDLFTSYVQKNVLNKFRQDHGYAQGTYLKIWDGREDNEWLVDLAVGIDSRDLQYSDLLYSALSECYKAKA
ncbi:dUTP diphosphatase [Janthinobacterium sp. JC611]|uniref:dUTP diphosphatase n=1 Tax=Janthinobacterium sp. JC611 TaxID=2816201 RepID=UPI001BFD840F|nr:dUTP diphosphatase [Janthinobacterium sp. JC611]